MFENRVQISRLSGVDGLVCDAGNLELDAMVNWKRTWWLGSVMVKASDW